jgi:hypothetical protein
MKLEEFNKGMDKMFAGRHINISAESIGIHLMPVSSYIGTYTKFLLMQPQSTLLLQKEVLTLILGKWWITGEQDCLDWMFTYVADLNNTKKIVSKYQKELGEIKIPIMYADRSSVEKLAYKAAYIAAVGVLGKSNLFTKQGVFAAADS